MEAANYKQTSVGLIPSDWEVKKLGEIGELKNGINKDKNDFGFGLPMVNLMDVFGINKIFKNNLNLGLVNSNARDLEEFSLRKGDVLFIRSSVKPTGVGLTTVICDDLENTTYSGFIIRFRDNGYINLGYKIHCFSEENFRKRLLNKSTISANANINQGALNSLKIPLPPLPEQEKIAQILSTWDVAIDDCKTIIEYLKMRNKGLSQKLLSGKMRVKGFEESKWNLLPIKKMAKQISNKNSKDKELIVLSCTKYKGLVPSLEYFGRKIYSDNLSTYKIVARNQFAYATNHIEEGSIGYQATYEEALISPMYTVFETENIVNDDFLFRILKSSNYIHEYQRRMEGSIDRRGGLRWDEFSKIKVSLPEIKEQNIIVEILDKATEELFHFQQKLEKLQLEKKGLMQQLLTGKVKVKI